MSNTYSQLYLHGIFAVKYRKATLKKEWRPQMLAVIGNLINETGCTTLAVNGVEDHVHIFFGLKPSVSISEVMQSVKGKSSKWMNESGLLSHRFEWQAGYGAFSYGRSQIEDVCRYIQNQEEHHKKETFRQEYIRFLEKFGIEYDEKYIFQDLA